MTSNIDDNSQRKLYIETPLIESRILSEFVDDREVFLKLETCQPTSSFKLRGLSFACQKAKRDGFKRIVCQSGGNAGLSAAYAARQLGLDSIVVLVNSTSQYMRKRIERENAKIIFYGDSSTESLIKAQSIAKLDDETRFIHPFDDISVWEGNSTLIDEIYVQLNHRQPAAIVTCCGGGGLFSGIMRGLERYGWHETLVFVLETEGTSSFRAMIENNSIPIEKSLKPSLAKTLAACIVCDEAARYYRKYSDTVISLIVNERDAVNGVIRFLSDHNLLIEPSCATIVSTFYDGILNTELNKRSEQLIDGPIVPVICGGYDVDFERIVQWKNEYEV